MGIIDWLNQPSCADLAPLAVQLKDPFAFISPLGGGVHAGFPSPPAKLYVCRAVLMTSAEVQAATRLLEAYYKSKGALDCLETVGWAYPAGRARALEAIAVYGKLTGFNAATGSAVVDMLKRIFADELASKASAADKEGMSLYAATLIVTDSRTTTLDQATWLPLWGWALGGAHGGASVKARIGAMKALQAILRRRTLMPRQIQSASAMADVLFKLIQQRAPSISGVQRDLFLADAEGLWGAMKAALQAAEVVAGPPPNSIIVRPPAKRKHNWLLIGGIGVTAAVGGAVLATRLLARPQG